MKVISVGQTGVDTLALMADKTTRLQTGVIVHAIIDELRTIKGLELIDQKLGFVPRLIARSKKNVDDSNATLAFRPKSSVGTDKTIAYCHTGKWKFPNKEMLVGGVSASPDMYRPVFLVVDFQQNVDKLAEEIADFCIKREIQVLNVAGPREVYGEVRIFVETLLCRAFSKVKLSEESGLEAEHQHKKHRIE
jgi:hypothetical protein